MPRRILLQGPRPPRPLARSGLGGVMWSIIRLSTSDYLFPIAAAKQCHFETPRRVDWQK